MRPIPRIKFLEEKETVEAGRIEELLEELKKEGK
jgi:ribosome-binding factor A